METRATTIKCVHLVNDALMDIFRYENNSYELCDVCRGLILSGINVSDVVLEGIKDNPHSDRSFGIKWHNMAVPAIND